MAHLLPVDAAAFGDGDVVVVALAGGDANDVAVVQPQQPLQLVVVVVAELLQQRLAAAVVAVVVAVVAQALDRFYYMSQLITAMVMAVRPSIQENQNLTERKKLRQSITTNNVELCIDYTVNSNILYIVQVICY